MEEIKLKEDIEFAESIIYSAKFASCCSFNHNSMVYRATNENVNNHYYREIISNKKRALSVIASGDQIINLILLGSEDITGYDISRFPKYYLALKLAALKKLSKEEYIEYIVGNNFKYALDRDLYSKFNSELPFGYRTFWDDIFLKFNEKQINSSSLFGFFEISRERMVANNPYLQDDNYYILRSKIDKIRLEMLDLNVFELKPDEFDSFDLIILSNIVDYLKDFSKDYRNYKAFLKSLPLTKNGIILSYSFCNDGYLDRYFRGRNFKVVKINQNIVEGEVQTKDEIITYQRQKKLSLF